MPNAMNIGFSFPTYINILAGASPPPNRDAQGVHRRIEAGQDGQIRRSRRRAMMTFAALVVAATLVASILYAMFSRTR
jgi:hypothetical protein